MFIPTTRREIQELGWDTLDVVLVTGDSYVDSPFIGVSVIGRVLLKEGYRVGIIAQPDVESDDITRLGEPALFWGVTGGSIDSMVANYTATKKKKRTDDLTPGGKNDRRPDRAVIVYANLIRRHFKNTRPIVLGGIEASLRRIAHYDYWSDSVRRSILFDAKADILVYGMAEKTVVDLARRLAAGQEIADLRGICYIARECKAGAIELPAFETVARDKAAFTEMFHTFYQNNDPVTARGLCQQQDTRYLIQNPPAPLLTQQELDAVHELDFQRAQHPYYERLGAVKALDTIRFSLSTHRGCYGECNFCSIAVHQGRTVRWRSQRSIVREARRLARDPDFQGHHPGRGRPNGQHVRLRVRQKNVARELRRQALPLPRDLPPDEGRSRQAARPAQGAEGHRRRQEGLRGLGHPLRHGAGRRKTRQGLPARRGPAPHLGPDEGGPRAHSGTRAAPDGQAGRKGCCGSETCSTN